MRKTGILPSIRALASRILSVGYIGSKGTRLPRLVEANPAIYEAGATFANSPRRRLYSGCTLTTGTCTLGTAGLVEGNANSTFHSAQASLTRRGTPDLNYTLAYTYSKNLDYSSSLHMSGPAPWLVLGELDIAQNNQDLSTRTRTLALRFAPSFRRKRYLCRSVRAQLHRSCSVLFWMAGNSVPC